MSRQEKIDSCWRRIMDAWRKTTLSPCPPEFESILKQAFDDNLYRKKYRLLRNPPSWKGYCRRDGTIDQVALAQCAANVLGKWLHWHRDRSANLGIAISAVWRAELVGKQLGFDGKQFADAIQTFALLLLHVHGIKSSSLDRWECALGRKVAK